MKKMKACTDEKTNDDITSKNYLGKKIAGNQKNEKVCIKQEHFCLKNWKRTNLATKWKF
jgi:hypothetical protein